MGHYWRTMVMTQDARRVRYNNDIQDRIGETVPRDVCGFVARRNFEVAIWYPAGTRSDTRQPCLVFDNPQRAPNGLVNSGRNARRGHLANRMVYGMSALAIVTGFIESGEWDRADLAGVEAARARRAAAEREMMDERSARDGGWIKYMDAKRILAKYTVMSTPDFIVEWNRRHGDELHIRHIERLKNNGSACPSWVMRADLETAVMRASRAGWLPQKHGRSIDRGVKRMTVRRAT